VERNRKAGQNPPRVVAPIGGGGGKKERKKERKKYHALHFIHSHLFKNSAGTQDLPHW
jgi:hypothetical protein